MERTPLSFAPLLWKRAEEKEQREGGANVIMQMRHQGALLGQARGHLRRTWVLVKWEEPLLSPPPHLCKNDMS